MAALNLQPNIADPDGLYAKLAALHEGLDERRSAVVNSKLILLLANHIGDPQVLAEAIDTAKAAHLAISSAAEQA
ncbi:hypothetical protein BV96_02956 [Sphingomonas paucimobilis]|nr:hypothetical protein BV96_02956 [Sphingomonas paucimobilis]